MDSAFVVRDFGTEQTRFGMDTLIQEWHDFLLTQCGYSEADHELIARLAWKNGEVFAQILHEETGMVWNTLDGTFGVSPLLFSRCGFDFPLEREQLDLIWSDVFNTVSEDGFDVIEEELHRERAHGLC